MLTQQRARGLINLTAKYSQGGTTLDNLRQAGSFRALFPRDRGVGMQAVLVNTAGGVTGGDTFQINANAKENTHLTLTTQAAERAYRAQTGQTGFIKNRLIVGKGAHLQWLPQETILFQGCAISRYLRIEMHKDASLLMVEPLVFGRLAMGEHLTDADFKDRIEIHRNGQIAYLDAINLQGNVAAHLARTNVAAGAGAMVSLIYVARDAQAQMTPLRAILPETAGISLIGDDLLVLRLLAVDGYLLRQSLIPILDRLTKAPLPRCWMI